MPPKRSKKRPSWSPLREDAPPSDHSQDDEGPAAAARALLKQQRHSGVEVLAEQLERSSTDSSTARSRPLAPRSSRSSRRSGPAASSARAGPESRARSTPPTGGGRLSHWRRLGKAAGDTYSGEAKTIHRLLDYNRRINAFLKNRNNPLEYDAIVVDEASMLDVHLVSMALTPKILIFPLYACQTSLRCRYSPSAS